jgi:hypothetical protein
MEIIAGGGQEKKVYEQKAAFPFMIYDFRFTIAILRLPRCARNDKRLFSPFDKFRVEVLYDFVSGFDSDIDVLQAVIFYFE